MRNIYKFVPIAHIMALKSFYPAALLIIYLQQWFFDDIFVACNLIV